MVGPPTKRSRGNLKYFSINWYKYTKDTYILDTVPNRLKLELNELPSQYSRSTYPLSAKENEVVSAEFKTLLKKKVIVHSTTEYNESISSIFTKTKKDGSKRGILNLKFLISLPTINISKWNPSIMFSTL